MNLASVRLMTNEIDRLIPFYEQLAGVDAPRLTPDFAELRLDGAIVAIGTERTIR